tara:strand:+ start:2318 stop:2929 length:612 start_codon:yes stop_codon:yes gene_type:complete
MLIIFLYFLNLYDFQDRIGNKDFNNKDDVILEYTENFIDKELDNIDTANDFILDSNDIYPIYKRPKKFLFIKKDDYLKKIIYDLRFIKKYDKGDYIKLIILIENFLKIYYNLIIDRYDIDYVDVLLDVRKEILNVMYNFKVDAPQYNRKQEYIHNKIQDCIVKVQSYSHQKLKNINKKFPKIHIKNPRGISKKDISDNYKIIV